MLLANIVFNDKKKLKFLEELLHKKLAGRTIFLAKKKNKKKKFISF